MSASDASFLGARTNALVQTTISRSVVCGIELFNATKYILTTEGYFAEKGRVKSPPVSIYPGMKEVIVTYKSDPSIFGTSGVAAWKIEGCANVSDTHLAIMWNVPWSLISHSGNTLAVGFKQGSISNVKVLYQKLSQHRANDPSIDYERWTYNNGKKCQPVEVSLADCFKIQGTMGTDEKCEVKIKFLPLTDEHAAKNFSEGAGALGPQKEKCDYSVGY